MIENEFETLKDNFFNKYCDDFEDKEENKFIYMDIFKIYAQSIETYIENVKTSNLANQIKVTTI
jgi:hypothetical protein